MKKKMFIGIGLALTIIALVSIGIIMNKSGDLIENKDTQIKIAQNDSDVHYDAYTYITEEMKENSDESTMYAELASEYTPSSMLNVSDTVALVTVVSLDGASMDYSTFGMTYGKILVNDVIVGDINTNEIIEYLKPGGYVTVADYDAHDIPASVAKRDYLRQQAGIEIDKENTYINLKVEDDIEIEAGKTYLAYLHYRENDGKYEIVGLRNGLREVNVSQVSSITIQEYSIDELQIKNNVTGEWESLDEYVKLNIENNK